MRRRSCRGRGPLSSMGSRLPPRLLSRLTRAPCRPASTRGSSITRNMAGDASLANRWLRYNTPSARPCSAASCSRRMARGLARGNQASAISHAPERSACSCAHNGRCVRTMSMRSSATPCAASAGAKGSCGGDTQVHQRAGVSRDNAASAGSSR